MRVEDDWDLIARFAAKLRSRPKYASLAVLRWQRRGRLLRWVVGQRKRVERSLDRTPCEVWVYSLAEAPTPARVQDPRTSPKHRRILDRLAHLSFNVITLPTSSSSSSPEVLLQVDNLSLADVLRGSPGKKDTMCSFPVHKVDNGRKYMVMIPFV